MPPRPLPALALTLAALLGLAACEPAQTLPDASALIARARDAHGSARLDSSTVTFDFRDARFTAARQDGRFAYRRATRDTLGQLVEEALTNDGVVRAVDGQRVRLSPQESAAVEGRVNSVVYFALLPHALADAAVQARTLGADTLHGEPYWMVEVTFAREGGGRDHDDRFVYWMHQTTSAMDYLAYTFTVNGGGARFRAAENVRTVGGIRFADYANFDVPAGVALEDLGALHESDRLDLLSTVETANVRVE